MKILEANTSLSSSLIWEEQKNYYSKKGIEAWSESVPFYITSNCFIADRYAKTFAAFIADTVAKHPETASSPFPLLELGAGTGQLSYYLCRGILEELKARNLAHIQLNYIVSDISEGNLSYIKNHQRNQAWVKDETMLFSLFDAIDTNTIKRWSADKKNGQTIEISNPLMVVANYLFDSLPCDVFYYDSEQLHDCQVSLRSNSERAAQQQEWSTISLSYSKQVVNGQHYPKKEHDDILQLHRNDEIDDTYITFPIGGFKAIDNLLSIANNKLFMLMADKAFSTLEDMALQDQPELDDHGSFSIMVNFYALFEYAKRLGGTRFAPSVSDGIDSGVLLFGDSLDELHGLRRELMETLDQFSPSDYFNLYSNAVRNSDEYEPEEMVSMLALSRWDPGLFDVFSESISPISEDFDQQALDRLKLHLKKIQLNYYFIPGSTDTLFTIGSLYYEMDEYEAAIAAYEESLQCFPGDYETLYNIALCHQILEQNKKAAAYFKQALEICPNDRDCLKQMKLIQEKTNA